MTTSINLAAAGAGGRQMQEHRIPAMLVAGGRIGAVADPATGAAEQFVRGFASPKFLERLRERGYPVTDEAAVEFSRARVYQRVDDMLAAESNLTGLLSAVPAVAHADVAIRAMRAGLDVSSDKPTADNPERAAEMLQVAKQKGKVLQIGYQWGVQLQELRKVLAQRAIGDITGGSSDWSRQAGIPEPPHFWEDPATGGVTRDVVGHQVAGITASTGCVPVAVRARASREAGVAMFGKGFKAEDTVEAEVRCLRGELWNVSGSWATGRLPRERAGLEIYGDREDTWADAPVIVQKDENYVPDPGAFKAVIRVAGAAEPAWLADDAMTYIDAMIAQAVEFLYARDRGGELALPAIAAVRVEFVLDAILRSAAACNWQWGPWTQVGV